MRYSLLYLLLAKFAFCVESVVCVGSCVPVEYCWHMHFICLHTHPPHTPGVDFYSKALKVDDRIVSLQLWDTAGQERFQSVTKAYYRGAQGVILMYDISQEESFIAVKSWINSIQVRTNSHLTK